MHFKSFLISVLEILWNQTWLKAVTISRIQREINKWTIVKVRTATKMLEKKAQLIVGKCVVQVHPPCSKSEDLIQFHAYYLETLYRGFVLIISTSYLHDLTLKKVVKYYQIIQGLEFQNYISVVSKPFLHVLEKKKKKNLFRAELHLK